MGNLSLKAGSPAQKYIALIDKELPFYRVMAHIIDKPFLLMAFLTNCTPIGVVIVCCMSSRSLEMVISGHPSELPASASKYSSPNTGSPRLPGDRNLQH